MTKNELLARLSHLRKAVRSRRPSFEPLCARSIKKLNVFARVTAEVDEIDKPTDEDVSGETLV